MEYLIFASYQDAQVRNAELCFENGCPDTYYFLVIEHPTNNEAALVVPEYLLINLTEQEQANIKNSDFMLLNGWNININ